MQLPDTLQFIQALDASSLGKAVCFLPSRTVQLSQNPPGVAGQGAAPGSEFLATAGKAL